jgi:hypothetical protein
MTTTSGDWTYELADLSSARQLKPESSRRGLRAADAGATVTAIDFARRGASTLHD